jgi:hypothetical protein
MKRYLLHAYDAHRRVCEGPPYLIIFVAHLLHILLLLQIFVMDQVGRLKLAHYLILDRELDSIISYHFTLNHLL